MGIGKYSPTVSHSYRIDQGWWEKNGGGFGNGKNPDSDMDDEGYDSYGYGEGGYINGKDRAGVTEHQYGEHVNYNDGDSDAYLYNRVSREWSRLLCGVKHVSKYPAITGIVAESVHPTYIIVSTITRELDDTVTHGTVNSEQEAVGLVKLLNDRSPKRGPFFYYEEVKPISSTVDEIFQAALNA